MFGFICAFRYALPARDYGFAGMSDARALQHEVAVMRDELAGVTQQLAIERDCAEQVHQARRTAIYTSPALSLVYGVDDPEIHVRGPKTTAAELLSSAFIRAVPSRSLPEGYAESMSRVVRIAVHPDEGGDDETAKLVGKSLANADTDPAFSVATAILAAGSKGTTDIQSLRDERYQLALATAGLAPIFETAEKARANAGLEIEGAQWRVRVKAIFKTVELLIGDNDIWQAFLNDIAREGNYYLTGMVNRIQPELLALQERIAKGDPVKDEQLDTVAIDAILLQIWTTIGAKTTGLPYRPPYQNWLETFLPAVRLMDPGNKPGEEYTQFEPPIQLRREPVRRPSYNESDHINRTTNLGGGIISITNRRFSDDEYNNY